MIIYDFEVFKYDWCIVWLDTQTRKLHNIVNDTDKFKKFYDYYKNQIWVGYNSRAFDTWIAKAILCGFNPYEMNDWIINKNRKGFEFSRLLNQYPILNYDCSVGFRSLKELEAFMGHDIRETTVPFNIDRRLTQQEIDEVLFYCKHDVMETFQVFIETAHEYESHIGLIKEFSLDITNINKTKAQLSAIILDASRVNRSDEFDLKLPDNMELGKYEYIRDYFINWGKNVKDYDKLKLTTEICGVEHNFGIGGLHGAIPKYYGEGFYLMADVASYYPAGMIEYDFLSRNVHNKNKYRQIRDERIILKQNKDPRQAPRKIVLNSTFGASKDPYNNLYDPLQANNLCITCQLFLVDLLEKLEGKCELIQSNTDGILIKLFKESDKDMIVDICNNWSKRTRFNLEIDEYRKVFQKDVNNYIIVDNEGHTKRKGAIVKKLNPLDNDLPIINKAVYDYLVNGIPVEDTVNNEDKLISFQKITKVSNKYSYAIYNGEIKHEKVYRCFASKLESDGTLYKKHKNKTTYDKTAGTPEHTFIDNTNIIDKPIPSKLDKNWYIELAKRKIADFVNF